MKLTIEVSDEEYISAMRKGWNSEYDENLEDTDFSLPPVGDLTDMPFQEDVIRAIPYLSRAKYVRIL